jgi:S1-C subfamily serine protease
VIEVSGLASPIAQLAATPIEPVVAHARVEGVRLREDIPLLGLRRGDVLTSIDGRRITASAQVLPALRRARTRMSLIVRRERHFGVIDLVTR